MHRCSLDHKGEGVKTDGIDLTFSGVCGTRVGLPSRLSAGSTTASTTVGSERREAGCCSLMSCLKTKPPNHGSCN
jgi:hypothetical protein